MNPVVKYHGVDYYEYRVQSHHQLDTAVRLSKLSQFTPMSHKDLDDFLSYSMDGVREAFLLASIAPAIREAPSRYLWSPDTSPIWTPGTPPGDSWGTVFAAEFEKYQSQSFEALLLLDCVEDDFDLEAPVVSVAALCRDPWSEAAPTASWLDMRLRDASEALGGALELRISVPEADTPLQRELRGMGYFAEDYLPDQTYNPSLPWSRNLGSIRFIKLLRIRDRHLLGRQFLSPKIPSRRPT